MENNDIALISYTSNNFLKWTEIYLKSIKITNPNLKIFLHCVNVTKENQEKILKWNEEDGVVDYKKQAGNTGYSPNLGKGLLGPNGMIYDSEKDLLIVCQHGDRRIAILKNGFL